MTLVVQVAATSSLRDLTAGCCMPLSASVQHVTPVTKDTQCSNMSTPRMLVRRMHHASSAHLRVTRAYTSLYDSKLHGIVCRVLTVLRALIVQCTRSHGSTLGSAQALRQLSVPAAWSSQRRRLRHFNTHLSGHNGQKR